METISTQPMATQTAEFWTFWINWINDDEVFGNHWEWPRWKQIGFVGNEDSFLLLSQVGASKGFEYIDTGWSYEARVMIESMWREKV